MSGATGEPKIKMIEMDMLDVRPEKSGHDGECQCVPTRCVLREGRCAGDPQGGDIAVKECGGVVTPLVSSTNGGMSLTSCRARCMSRQLTGMVRHMRFTICSAGQRSCCRQWMSFKKAAMRIDMLDCVIP